MLREVFVVHHTVSPSNDSWLRTAWLNMLRVVVDSDTQLKAFCEDALTASAVLPLFILADVNIADKLPSLHSGLGSVNWRHSGSELRAINSPSQSTWCFRNTEGRGVT